MTRCRRSPLARNTVHGFLRDTDANLTLCLRQARRLQNPDPKRVPIVEGDVIERAILQQAMKGQGVDPRLTEDLDVFVDVSPENASRIRAALVDFGLATLRPPKSCHSNGVRLSHAASTSPCPGNHAHIRAIS